MLRISHDGQDFIIPQVNIDYITIDNEARSAVVFLITGSYVRLDGISDDLANQLRAYPLIPPGKSP